MKRHAPFASERHGAYVDPLLGLAVGTGAGALLALASGAVLLRYHGFTFLMLTAA